MPQPIAITSYNDSRVIIFFQFIDSFEVVYKAKACAVRPTSVDWSMPSMYPSAATFFRLLMLPIRLDRRRLEDLVASLGDAMASV